MTIGFWAHILKAPAEPSSSIFSGCLAGKPQLCACPSCAGDMFPVFNVTRGLSVLPRNDNFYANEMLTLDVCPQCPLSLKNYAVRYSQGGRQVVGGYKDPDGPIYRMDKPYQSRAVELESVDAAFWTDDDELESYYDRQLLKGVYHQFGGRQLKENRRPCEACLICGGAIQFFGCIDNDDLNIPLYENKDPRALVIGDMQTLNLFACEGCAAVNYCMSV